MTLETRLIHVSYQAVVLLVGNEGKGVHGSTPNADFTRRIAHCTRILAVLRVDMPNSNTTKIWTPIFECYLVRCKSKNEHQKDMCLSKIGLCAQKFAINSRLSGQHDWEGDLYDHLMSMRIFPLVLNKISI